MDKFFALHPAANPQDYTDAIQDRLIKIKAILTCLVFAVEFVNDYHELDKETIYLTLTVVEGFVEEINCLYDRVARSQSQ